MMPGEFCTHAAKNSRNSCKLSKTPRFANRKSCAVPGVRILLAGLAISMIMPASSLGFRFERSIPNTNSPECRKSFLPPHADPSMILPLAFASALQTKGSTRKQSISRLPFRTRRRDSSTHQCFAPCRSVFESVMEDDSLRGKRAKAQPLSAASQWAEDPRTCWNEKPERGSRRAFLTERAVKQWQTAGRSQRVQIVTAASGEEFNKALPLLLPEGAEWVHVTAPEAAGPSGRKPKPRDSGELAFSGGEEVVAVTVDLTLCGNDLLLDTLACLTRLTSLHRASLQTVLIKSRAIADLALRLLPASKALARGPLLFSDRPLNRPVVLCCVGVAEYRAMIPLICAEGDAVLEVGCHGGTTTREVAQVVGGSGLAVGVDIGVSIVEQARRINPHVRFEVADAWDSYRLVELAGERRWDAVMVDVGGLSGHDGVLEAVALLRQLTSAMPSVRAIVIKSACMRALASSFLPANELLPALQPPAPAPP